MESSFTSSGILFMTLGWGTVISLFLFCMYKVWKSESGAKTKVD